MPTLEDLLDVPPPPGRSRESTIRLDQEGHFHHDGDPFVHAGLSAAMHSWITRHPRNGRYVLYNGIDWSYFAVDDAPYVVRHLELASDGLRMHLSDGTFEICGAEPMWLGDHDALYTFVKRLGNDTALPYVAKFSRHAQAALAPYLHALENGAVSISLPGGEVVIGPKPSFG